MRIGGITVLPGDIVIGDDGGAFFFPPELVDDVLEYANSVENREAFQLELLEDQSYRFRDVYPLTPTLQDELRQRQNN